MSKSPIRKKLQHTEYQDKCFLPRPQGKKSLHLLHIGKTGGTALKQALLPHAMEGNYIIKMHGHNVTLHQIPRGDKVMFFLRDPVTRFVSGFLSRQRQGQPRYFSPWSLDEKIAFTHFDTPNALARSLGAGNIEERAAAEAAMQCIEHVSAPYLGWFGTRENLLARYDDILLVGYQESLTADFERLCSKLDLSESVSLPSDPVKAHRNPDSLDAHLDEKAVANLRQWYADDIDFVAFCRANFETS